MYLKIYFLDLHLEFIPENLDTESDEHGEHFHQKISITEKLQRGKWSASMLAEYCWPLKRNAPLAKFSIKSNEVTF
jgi:hypothetical protein